MTRLLIAGSCLLFALLGAGPQQFQRVCQGGVCRLVPIRQQATARQASPVPVAQVVPSTRVVYQQPVQQAVVYQQASYGYTSPVDGRTYRSRFAARRPVAAFVARGSVRVVRGAVRVARFPVRVVRRVVFGRFR